MTEERLSPIGQSKTWTARKTLPVACAYAAAHRWAAREAGESSSPIMTMPFVIMIKGPVTGFRCQIGCCLDAGCRTDRTRQVLAGCAESAHWEHLQPLPGNRLGAALADSVRAILEPL